MGEQHAGGTILWDFDGTLVSRPSMWSRAARRALDKLIPEHGIPMDRLVGFLGTGFPWHQPERPHTELNEPDAWWTRVGGRFVELFCELGCSRAAADELVGKVRCDILDPSQYKLFDDAVPTLTQLQREGWHHVVLSDHVPELEGLIRGLGIADHFERVFTSARIGFEKPHPRIFEVALAEISFVGPIWMLGDSVDADCFPARHLGIDAILVRTNDERYRPRAADLPGAVELISRPTASPAPPSGRR